MRIDDHVDPEVEALAGAARLPIFNPGSDAAVNRDAPEVTGDRVMDTQLENLRILLCSRVWSVYQLVLRAKKIRLWAVESPHGEGEVRVFPPSLAKRDDHPLVAVLVRQAQELAKVDDVTCEAHVVTKYGELVTYLDSKLQLMQVQTRLRVLSDVQATAMKIEAMGTDALSQAQDLVKSFHAMAQQWKIHVTKQATAAAPTTDLQRLASLAFRKDTPAP